MSDTTTKLNIGDKVRCMGGNIDRQNGKGEVGYVTGFARFSAYHPREAYVSNRPEGEGHPTAPWCGWFWVADLEAAQ